MRNDYALAATQLIQFGKQELGPGIQRRRVRVGKLWIEDLLAAMA